MIANFCEESDLKINFLFSLDNCMAFLVSYKEVKKDADEQDLVYAMAYKLENSIMLEYEFKDDKYRYDTSSSKLTFPLSASNTDIKNKLIEIVSNTLNEYHLREVIGFLSTKTSMDPKTTMEIVNEK